MAKRASMREGPLAALFRSTDEALEEDDIQISAGANGNGNGSVDVEDAGAAVAIAEPEVIEPEFDEPDFDDEPEIEVTAKPAPRQPKSKKNKRRKRGAPKRSRTVETEPVQTPAEPQAAEPAPAPEAYREPEPAPAPAPEPELEPAPEPAAPERRERLRHLIGDPAPAVTGERPAFGREEPDTSRYAATPRHHTAQLRVVGVGGAGVNAVNRMIEAEIPGVDFIALNTDLQSLHTSNAEKTLHIGAELTRGLGSGADPRIGYRAAFEEQDEIKNMLKGSDMVFVTAGAGGGTGTGAAPVVAKLARDVGALTVGIVTKPFAFEGARRSAQAEEGVAALGAEVDTLIVVPNEKLLGILERRTSMVDAFGVADDVLRQAVQGISDLVMLPGLINLDFADVRTTMLEAGDAILGIGMGSGEHRAIHAAEKAVDSPLLETSVNGARSILLSITGGADLSLIEASEAARVVQEAAHPEANIIFGANVDEDLEEQVWVTVIATRFDSAYARRYQRSDRPRRPQGPEPRSTTLSPADIPEFIPGH